MDAIFIDLDGTLLCDDHTISAHNLESLGRLDALGIPYFIATGRPGQLVKKIVHDLTYTRPMILYNGSVIQSFKDAEPLYERALPSTAVQDILNYALRHDYLTMLYTEEAIFSDENERTAYFKAHQKEDPIELQTTFRPMARYHDETVYKILIVEHDDTRYQTIKKHLETFDLTVVQSQKGFLDINPKEASKGAGVRFLQDHYGFDPQKTIAFGDQENDISMIHEVGLFVAMGNAVPSVKDQATIITTSNNDDGVTHALKKLNII